MMTIYSSIREISEEKMCNNEEMWLWNTMQYHEESRNEGYLSEMYLIWWYF